MQSDNIQTIVLFGAGNVAWHLGCHLKKCGLSVLQVVNRSKKKGMELAGELRAGFTDHYQEVRKDADLYIIALSDDAIPQVVDRVHFGNSIVVHTAGSVNMHVFMGKVQNYGVLYPFQTFTQGREIDLHNVPVLLEAVNETSMQRLQMLAEKLTQSVYQFDSEKRLYLHIAAVFASNFTNHLLAIAEKILTDKDIDYGLMKPLLEETISKALSMSPAKAQTGPAVRGNLKVIQRHLEILENYPAYIELYKKLSDSITGSGSESILNH